MGPSDRAAPPPGAAPGTSSRVVDLAGRAHAQQYPLRMGDEHPLTEVDVRRRYDSRPVERVRVSLGVFVTLAGLAGWVTILFLAQRAVIEVGGVCAEGSPYVSQRPCPKGVAWLTLASIWGTLVFCALYAWQTIKHEVFPRFLALVWSVAYFALAWNFLEFGVNPPGDDGVSWTWLACALIFIVAGAVPLYLAVPAFISTFKRDPA